MVDTNYNADIERWILVNLDGWKIGDIATTPKGEIAPFLTDEELNTKANKTITSDECSLFYEETLDLAYMHTNRLNIDDLDEVHARTFIRAVCKWTASNLWNKYNIKVNNEDMEDTYTTSYGGLLYKSALKTLEPFIVQNITSITTIRKNKENNTNNSNW